MEALFYSCHELMEMLNLNGRPVYVWMQRILELDPCDRPFKVVKVGVVYRIEKKSFDAWLLTK